MTDSTPPKALSLFTGVGGLDLGLESAGFTLVGSVELDSKARDALLKNRPQWRHLAPHDICQATSVTPQSLGMEAGELDLIAGGPPCQPFSTAAQWVASGRQGMQDKRANTIPAMLDIIESLLPRAVLIENVAGFIRGNGSALPAIENQLRLINARRGVNYVMSCSVVDSAAYGVPQHRRRVIIVLSRDGKKFCLPPAPHEKHPITAWDAIGNIDPGPLPPLNGRWTALLPCIPEGQNYQWLTARGGGEEIFGYRTRYWSFLLKLAKDLPSWTISASPGPSTGPFHWDNRPLSITELLRLQTFPADWIVVGSSREQIRQIGNATPPLLAEIMGRAIAEQLLGRSAGREPLVLGLSRNPEKPPPTRPPTRLPESLRLSVGPKPAHPGTGLGPASRTMDRRVRAGD